MKCPIDDTMLVMSDRNGIEIDYCPQCRGVWLDRGELDKIIERASLVAPQPPAAPRVDLPPEPSRAAPGLFAPQETFAQPSYPPRWGSHSPDSAPRYGQGYRGVAGKRPKNWLSELFD